MDNKEEQAAKFDAACKELIRILDIEIERNQKELRELWRKIKAQTDARAKEDAYAKQ